MMSANSTRTIQGISDELAASKMLIQELLTSCAMPVGS